MVLLLAACLSRYLDAPYVLSTGLEQPVQLDAGPGERLVVTTATGALQIDGTGRATAAGATPERRRPTRPGARLETRITEGLAWVDAAGALRVEERLLVHGLEAPRALGHDARDRLYVVAGTDEPRLYRLEGERLVLLADFVGPVVDMAWGPGGALPERMLYLLREDGILEYLEPS